MSNPVSASTLKKAIGTISTAAANQPGNQAELLKLVTRIPAISESHLPYPLEPHSVENESTQDAADMFGAMAKHYANELKHLFHTRENYGHENQKVRKISETLDNLILLGGCEFAKKKLVDVLSHEAYTLIQESMDYTCDFRGTERNISSLTARIKTVARDAIEAMFFCSQLKLTIGEQTNIISNMILEKLSSELLSVIDSLKETLPKLPVPENSTDFITLHGTAEDVALNSTNLVLLANILDCFLDLESTLRESHCKLQKDGVTRNDQSRKSSLKHRSKLPDILRSSQEASWIRSTHIYGDWDWQEVVKDIGPLLIKSISNAFDECQTKELISLRMSLSAEVSNNFETARSVSSIILPSSKTPKMTLKNFESALTLMKKLLPYAVLGSHYRPLCSLMSSYIDECNQMLKAMKSFIAVAQNDFPEKIPITSLYHCLAACEDVHSVVTFCAIKIEAEPRLPFQGTLQSYKDLSTTLKNIIVQNLSVRIHAYVLHDAESDHFRDLKEFADGESCSHSISNFKNFMERLWFDLDASVSEHQRSEIFTNAFLSSLKVLVGRYYRCEPSYNRTKQLTFDIPVIVAFCEQYRSGQSLFVRGKDFTLTDTESSMIRANCNILRSVMCLVAGPLSIVDKVLSALDAKEKAVAVELPFKAPSKMPDGIGQASLAHCLCDLLSKSYSSLKMLLSDSFMRRLDETSRFEFATDVYILLASCSSLCPDAFSACAFETVEKTPQMLMKVITPSTENCTVSKFAWQKLVQTCLYKVLCESLTTAAIFICSPTWSPMALNVVESLPGELRNAFDTCKVKSSSERSYHISASVILIIQGLTEAIYLFPEWLVTFMSQIQFSTHGLEANVTFGNVCFHVLLHATCFVLNTPELWEEFSFVEFTEEGLEVMQQSGSYLMKLCQTKSMSTNDLENVIKTQLFTLNKEITECFGMHTESEFQYSGEQLLQECNLQVANLLSNSEEGLNGLSRIKTTLASHHQWLQTASDEEDIAQNREKLLAESDAHAIDFNWEEMCQKAVKSLDWESIKTLIFHRWEMRDGAALTADDILLTRKIKLKLGPEENIP